MKTDDAIVIRFEGVSGSPLVSGICIRKAPTLLGTWSFRMSYILTVVMT